MEKIEIYSSKKKSILLLIGSVLFVIGGIYMFIDAYDVTGHRIRNPYFTKGIGIVAVLFFAPGIYLSVKQLIDNQLMLIITKTGINLHPKRSPIEFIEWENILGFSEFKIHSQKLLVIELDNPEYYIDKERNPLLKKLMKYNLEHYGSPFNFSANSLQIDHTELKKILNESMTRFKNKESDI